MTDEFTDLVPTEMRCAIEEAVEALHNANKPLALSHIDADGITAISIVIQMLNRMGKKPIWRNLHQLNSETILTVEELVDEHQPDIIIFSDFGTGQRHLIEEFISDKPSIDHIIILDHHLPPENTNMNNAIDTGKIIEINPWFFDLSGSYDISGAGVSFLLAYFVSKDNVDLSELAIVGATGDLQHYYGRGFVSLNKAIIKLAEEHNSISVDRDLTFFGINTRPLPLLLEYATDPFIPGLTGNREACYSFFEDLDIDLKIDDETWKTWVDLEPEEKQRVTQKLFQYILEVYDDPLVAQGIIGDVFTLNNRPPRTDLRSAKEFSTLLNACGRNRRPDIGVMVCLGDEDAIARGMTLLQQHRANLAGALRRLEENGYDETTSIYIVNDPQTPDTIIGIVIGMAQGARIIPIDKPVIGVSTNTSDDGPMVKISGRARKSLVKQGVNLKEAFSSVAEVLNNNSDELIAEAGGHPMAAGAFVRGEFLEQFLNSVSTAIEKQIR
jgi:single-stranded-DNA-specific exonuclease